MSDAKPTDLESLISRLRASRVPEIRSLMEQLVPTSRTDAKHACMSCGRSSATAFIEVTVAGDVAYSSPTQWVYCYRERDKPLGLCDQCFGLGRLDGFTPDEIAFFREGFEQTDEADDVA